MPLTIACDKGHHGTVEVLLEHKVDVNAKDNVSREKDARVRLLGG